MHGRTTRRSWWPEALPQLLGITRQGFLACWALTFAAAIVSTIAVLPDVYRDLSAPVPARAMLGLSRDQYARPNTLGPPIGPEAVRAGIRRGDRLIAIDGRPAAATDTEVTRQLAGPMGARVTITTLAPDGRRTDHVRTRDPAHYNRALASAGLSATVMKLPSLLQYATSLLILACGIVLLARRARDPLAPWASLMMVAMTLAVGPTGGWFAQLFPDPFVANYFPNAVAFALLTTVLALFPTGRFEPRWSLPVVIFGVLSCIATEPMPNWVSNSVSLVANGAAIAATIARYRGMPPGAGRQQIRWVLFGFVASLIALAAVVISQYAYGRTDDFGASAWLLIGSNLSGSLLFLLLTLGITVGLLRYRLYDADTAISRSVVYGALTLSLLAIFAGSEKVIDVLGERYFGEELGALAGGLGAAVAAVMIAPIHHRVSHWAEHRFRSGLAHLRHGLPLLVGDLRETASPRVLADAMLVRVEKGVRARHGAVVVGATVLDVRDVAPDAVRAWLTEAALPADTEGALDCDRADPLFPMRVPLQADGTGLVGWLLLGPRPDRSFFGREDRAALREIADPVARALAIAIAAAREARETTRDREIAGLRDVVRQLQQQMDRSGLRPQPAA